MNFCWHHTSAQPNANSISRRALLKCGGNAPASLRLRTIPPLRWTPGTQPKWPGLFLGTLSGCKDCKKHQDQMIGSIQNWNLHETYANESKRSIKDKLVIRAFQHRHWTDLHNASQQFFALASAVHVGGTPTLHAYATLLWPPGPKPAFPLFQLHNLVLHISHLLLSILCLPFNACQVVNLFLHISHLLLSILCLPFNSC